MHSPLRTALPQLTDRIELGTSGLRVSPICLGITSTPATIAAAYEAGINFFFVSADMHWPYYEATRAGLVALLRNGKPRDGIVVAAVSYLTQPEFCAMPFREAVEALSEYGTLDVLVAGGAYGHEFPRRLRVYEDHRRNEFLGARAIGVSFHDRNAALAAVTQSSVDIAFLRYGPGFAKARADVLPHIPATRTTRLFNFKSTVGYVDQKADTALPGLADAVGPWRPEITDHYRFVLSRPEIDGTLCALSTPAEVRALADALKKGPLDIGEEEYLLRLCAGVR